MASIVLVSAGGFLGANLRYSLSVWAARRFGPIFPWGTLVANVGGSFAIGVVLGLLAHRVTHDGSIRLLLVTGFLGGETTFSTFSFETVALVRLRRFAVAASYLGITLLAGLLAVCAGLGAAELLSRLG